MAAFSSPRSLSSLVIQGTAREVENALLAGKIPGSLAITAAVERDDAEVLRLLAAHAPAKTNLAAFLPSAAKNGRLQSVMVLLEQPADWETVQRAVRAGVCAGQWDVVLHLAPYARMNELLHDTKDRVRDRVVQGAPVAVMAAILAQSPSQENVQEAFHYAVAWGMGKRVDMVRVLLPHVDAKARQSGALRLAIQGGKEELIDLLWPHSEALPIAVAFAQEKNWACLDRMGPRLPANNRRALVFQHGETLLPRTHNMVVQQELARQRSEQAEEIQQAELPLTTRPRPRP